jgi:hypothetical protein
MRSSKEAVMSEAQRIAALEEEVRLLLGQKRELELKLEELTPRKVYVANAGECFGGRSEMGAVCRVVASNGF